MDLKEIDAYVAKLRTAKGISVGPQYNAQQLQLGGSTSGAVNDEGIDSSVCERVHMDQGSQDYDQFSLPHISHFMDYCNIGELRDTTGSCQRDSFIHPRLSLLLPR